MDLLVKGHTLLVGEGDFSFAVALVTKLLSSNINPCITATSLETEETIKKHKDAEEHIQWLRDKGVTVYLHTDATSLHTSPAHKDQRYSCIIFNFPHSGGKSNHKKNRKLLDDFFASAARVISKQGQIVVTLCKGQGGTPADKPMRAWHDSWQVVSMAANSSLILVRTLPFDAEEYFIYSSTGFRSQDKGFNTTNAVIHVFERAESVTVPESLDDCVVIYQSHRYLCPRYYYNKLESLRCFEDSCSHPFIHLSNLLHQGFDKITDVVSFKRSEWSQEDCEASKKDKISILDLPSSCVVENAETECSGQCILLNPCHERQQENGIHLDHQSPERYTSNVEKVPGLCLRKSLIEKVDLFDPHKEGVQLFCGPVFQQCEIDIQSSPVQYHMAGRMLVRSRDKNLSCDFKGSSAAEQSSCGEHLEELDQLLQHRCGLVVHVIESVLNADTGNRYSVSYVPLQSKHSFQTRVYHCGRIVVSEQKHSDTTGKSDHSEIVVVDFYTHKHSPSSAPHLMFVIAIDQLAKLKYNINDFRFLWLPSNSVISECSSRTGDSDFMPHSLYPMTFTHDMSFWENPDVDFVELKFLDLVRNVAGDTIKSVTLIDKYQEEESARVSRCYRLVFQSCDLALSYNCSWKLQSVIRLYVAENMSIILR